MLSEAKKTKSKDNFKWHSKNTLPKAPVIKETWDLKGLYYKSGKDPQIEADIKAAERAYTNFSKKWSGRDFLASATALKQALTEYEELAGLPEVGRPGRYFSLRQSLNVNDADANRQLTLLSKRLRKASDQVLFFSLKLGKAPLDLQKHYLADETLTHFHYFLEQLWLGAKYHLSEAEEKIIRLKSRQSSGMWADAVEKIISNRQIVWKGKPLHLPVALETLELLKTNDKIALWDKLMTEMEKVGEMAEHEMNAIILDARGEDELRGYKKPYSATALAYEDDEKSIENLTHAVRTRGYKLSREFYKLKASYHKVPALHYVQKYESIGRELSISFKEAVNICRDVFYSVKEEYGVIFDTMLKRGQIDVFPQGGKRGGAFMSSDVGHPTHVFLNHVSNFKSLETLAHEMGHAIHAERSKKQTPFYEGHSIITAETASTLFENLVFDAVFNTVSDRDKLTLLHDRITRDIATIERQVAFFDCELELHNTIEEKGAMESKEMAECMQKHLKAYLGAGVLVEPKDGYSYAYIPHLRYGFYVYSYAYGILMSTIMANHYKEDHGYAEQIDQFLSAGGSANVGDIFKSIGIDTKREDTFLKALDNQAKDIATFKQMLKKFK